MPATKTPTKYFQARDFSGGLNRTDARTAIRDNQAFWNENVQPIGKGQVTTLPPPGAIIATIPAGIASLWGINIKLGGLETQRLISVNKDGSMSQIDPATGAVVVVATAGTVTALARMAMWQDTPLLIIDPVHGYFSWDGTTLLTYPLTLTGTTHTTAVITGITPNTTGLQPGMAISGAGIPVGDFILSVDSSSQITLNVAATASATVTLTVGAGAPLVGRDIAVFEGRVWIQSALRAITFSAPDSFTDFSAADGGGSATIIDNVFIGKITKLLSALEQLWIGGAAAINSISNVQITTPLSGPPLTTFSNTNIVANVGSVRTDSFASFFRTFLFLAPYGVYAIVGATPQKLSDDLDGLFPFLRQNATDRNPAGVFSLNEVFVWAVFVQYEDPEAGLRPILLCFARNAWFVASQGNDLTYITSLVDPDTGSPNLYGVTATGGIFQCFAGTGEHTYTFQTKLWDFGSFMQIKQPLRIGFEFFSTSGNPITANVFVESNQGSSPVQLEIDANNQITWVGDNGKPIIFIGDNGLPITWITSGFTLSRAPVNFHGNYNGIQVSGTSFPFTMSAFALEYDPEGEWTQ